MKKSPYYLDSVSGFKGARLSILLNWLGSDVYGFALPPSTNPNLYELANVNETVSSTIEGILEIMVYY